MKKMNFAILSAVFLIIAFISRCQVVPIDAKLEIS